METIRKTSRKRLTFTLVEMVIVAIVICVIMVLGVTNYRKVAVKARAGKAKHAISLIAEAEKMYKVDVGGYVTVAADAVEATVGSLITGMNLAGVDNDTDFEYSVTGAGVVSASNTAAIGSCAIGTAITFNMSTGVITVPECYK